jgi:hypothetical protein
VTEAAAKCRPAFERAARPQLTGGGKGIARANERFPFVELIELGSREGDDFLSGAGKPRASLIANTFPQCLHQIDASRKVAVDRSCAESRDLRDPLMAERLGRGFQEHLSGRCDDVVTRIGGLLRAPVGCGTQGSNTASMTV